MNKVLKSMRLHIGIFGKRNVGKSSLLNFITEQNVSIVSDSAGTTTDPVEKVMELLPIGPVVFADTAGVDDIGALGAQRVKKTYAVIDRIDIALVVCDYNGIDEFEIELIKEFQKRKTPFAVVVNKNDIQAILQDKLEKIKTYCADVISLNTKDKTFVEPIKRLILKIMPDGFFDEDKILDDILSNGDTVVQVIPVDSEAPKGRIILPQVRTIRNALDNAVTSVVVRDTELEAALANLKNPPKLVITDSQAFAAVNKIVPANIMLTSYSILFARLKGDLAEFVKGAKKISDLKEGASVLICESCTHPSSCEDIGRVKIPKLLKNIIGKELSFNVFSGHDFPENLEKYSLIIHCGGCMTNKKEILSRIMRAKQSGVPITNYGVAIAYCLGILDRAVESFKI